MISEGATVLVTGGSGFVGSHVADALTEHGFDVRVLDRRPSPYLQPGQKMLVGDLRDEKFLKDAVAGCEAVFHFAGIADIGEANAVPALTAEVNVLGTVNILTACVQARVKRFVFASTVYVYSNEGGFYKASKQACESFIETFSEQTGIDYTVLRFGTLYGRRAGMTNRIYAMINEALASGCIRHPGNGKARREFIHVRDAARLSVKALGPEYANKHYVLTGQERFCIAEAAEMIKEMLPGPIDIDFADSEPEGHYKLTPYAFSPRIGHKLVPNDFVDFGQGLLDCIHEQYVADELAEAV